MGKKKQVTVGAQGKKIKKEKKDHVQSMEIVDDIKKKSNRQTNKGNKVRGMKYRKAKEVALKKHKYTIKEAVTLLKKIKFEKFTTPVELHINASAFGLRGEVTLPHGTGKEIRVSIFDDAVEKEIKAGNIAFDVLLARPGDMKRLVPFARLLGPKGLMPSPKKGTVTEDVEKVAKKFKMGALHYKTEAKEPLIHQVVGIITFEEKALCENITAFIKAVEIRNIKKAFLCTTMSPSLTLDLASIT